MEIKPTHTGLARMAWGKATKTTSNNKFLESNLSSALIEKDSQEGLISVLLNDPKYRLSSGYELIAMKEKTVGSEPMLTCFKTNISGRADIVFFLQIKKLTQEEILPVVIGELQSGEGDHNLTPEILDSFPTSLKVKNTFNQLVLYQLASQRAYHVTTAPHKSHLLGFLMDPMDFYIFDLAVGFWTADVPIKLEWVKYCALSGAKDMYCCLSYLLQELTSKLDPNRVNEWPLRFPPSIESAKSALLSSALVQFTRSASDVESLLEEALRLDPDEQHTGPAFEKCLSDETARDTGAGMLLKVSGAFLSGGRKAEALWNLLTSLAEAHNFPQLRDSLRSLYVNLYRRCPVHKFCFSITRNLGHRCDKNSLFHNLWRNDRQRAATIFFSDVYTVGIQALQCKFCHWDISPPNIVFDGNKLHIIDWESIYNIEDDAVDVWMNRYSTLYSLNILSEVLFSEFNVAIAFCQWILKFCVAEYVILLILL